MTAFEGRWANLDTRIALVPGKDVLRLLRQRVQELVGVTLTEARIIDAMSKEDIPSDMQQLLQALEKFRTAPP